jgi:hypothetical protein
MLLNDKKVYVGHHISRKVRTLQFWVVHLLTLYEGASI